MPKQPDSGDPLFSNQLAELYVRQNMPRMLEYGHKVENDMAFLLMTVSRRIASLREGTHTPSIADQYDLVEIESPFTHCMLRITLCYVNGNWYIGGSGLTGRYVLFFQKLAAMHKGGESYDELVKNSFQSTSYYARLFSRLVELHPMIGITNMFFLDYVKQHYQGKLEWYESAVKHAQAILLTLQGIEDAVQERTQSPLVKEFITDVRKEFELLIVDCMNLAFIQACNQVLSPPRGTWDINDISGEAERWNKEGIINSHFRFEVQDDRQRTRYLQKIREFYTKHSTYFSWIQIKGLGDAATATEQLAEETGSIAMPFYIKAGDVGKFLRFLETYVKALKHTLDGKAQIMSRDGDYELRFRNGVSALFRGEEDTKVDPEIGKAQARISFKYEGVKIRFDRDRERGHIILDFGEADFGETLAIADMLIAGYEHGPLHPPSLMDTQLTRLIQYNDPSRKSEVKEIQARAKVALVAAAVMNMSFASFPHRKEYFASYHSSDHIAKKEYFDQFPHIASELEQLFQGKKEV